MPLLKKMAGTWLALVVVAGLFAPLLAQGPAQLTQVVEQAQVPITWPLPAAIGYGTPLDGTELDASSPVAGTFVYTPAAGAVLAVGQQVLSAVFTPADANYKVTQVQVPLTVRPVTGATFELGAAHTPEKEIVWDHGDTITLWLTPLGDFHQPITLSCAVTEGFTCALDQTVMRPVGVALPLRLTVTRVYDHGPGPVKAPTGTMPALMVLLLVLGRKRLRGASLLVLLVGVVGCGTTRTATVTITGKSLTETKTMVVHVVNMR